MDQGQRNVEIAMTVEMLEDCRYLWSVAEIARKLHVNRKTIDRWVSGTALPSVANFRRLGRLQQRAREIINEENATW